MNKTVYFVLLSILWNCLTVNYVISEDILEVNLSGYLPYNKLKNVYQRYVNLDEDVKRVEITNIDYNVAFLILQVHSYIENITLSYNSTVLLHSSVTGTNVGLVYRYSNSNANANFYIFRGTKYYNHATVLLAITVYDAFDPVPGGCNLSFANMLAPYQVVSYTNDYITDDSQPASAYGVSCDDSNKIEMEMYHIFLGEYDNTIETYFEGIKSMITVDDIRRYGRKVPSGTGRFSYHRLFSSYRGTGEVFAIVATYKNQSSAYVPAVSYGCDLTNWDGSCVGPITRYWKFICALLLILGLTITFYGHKFFKFSLFTIGFAFGVLVTYFITTLGGRLDIDEKMVTSLTIAFFYGIIWIFIWWKFGIPVLSVHLNFILSASLVASIIFYTGLADIYIFRNDLIFWVMFSCIIMGCLIIFVPISMHSHIFGCSFLGSYAFFIALNYYLGGNLQYIVINTYRRATVRYFNEAVISPPFQIVDIMHSIGWLIVIITGCLVQFRDQRGKPPFPPNRNGVVLAARVSERTPLIPRENIAVPEYV